MRWVRDCPPLLLCLECRSEVIGLLPFFSFGRGSRFRPLPHLANWCNGSTADFDSVGVSSTLAFAAIRLRLTDNKRTKYPHQCRPVTSRVRTKHWGDCVGVKNCGGSVLRVGVYNRHTSDSLAQLAEHSAVNRKVIGSSPIRAASCRVAPE